MSQIDLNKLSEEEILELISDELSEDELTNAKNYKLCDETISVNFNKCHCANLPCSNCLFGREKRSYVLEKLNIQEQLDLSDYSDDDIVKQLKTIYKYDDLGDLKNEPDSLCQIKGNPFYGCDCLGIACSDCILHTSNRFNLIKLLKDSKPKEIMEDKPSDAIELIVIRRVHHGLDSTIEVDWPIGHRTWARFSYKNEFTKYGTIHPENNKYKMNIPGICFAPINPFDFKGPFKVGDWVEITKSDINWAPSMDDFIGKKVQITKVYNNGWEIKFKEDTRFTWNYYQGHFISCETSESSLTPVTKKYTIEELETNSKLVLYIDNSVDFIKIKQYTKRLTFDYYGQYCYSLYDGTYSSNSSSTNLGSYSDNADTIITIDDLIFPEIKEEENTFNCTLLELEEREDLVVFLETEEEYNQLKQYTENLVTRYYGECCYSLYSQTYSGNSTKISPGGYTNAKIVLFKNIILPIFPLSDRTVCGEPILTKKSTFGQEEIYIIPLFE